jgi:hypothetical protein
MHIALTIVQLIIALGILNVWLLRFNKPSAWRAGAATNMQDEFAVYGLPSTAMYVVGSLKIVCALLLIGGVWLPRLTAPGAMGLAVLMLGAVAMHVKVGDPAKKSLPAGTLLILSLLVATLS